MCEIQLPGAIRADFKERYLKNYLSSRDTIFSALETDYINDFNDSGPKTLAESSMDLILSDWYISRCLEGKFPKIILIKLINRAMETGRILSVKFLLERYPLEEFVFPIPDYLKFSNLLVQQKLPIPIRNSIRNMKEKLNIMVEAFKNVVLEKNAKSNLRILNFSLLPHWQSLLRNLCQFFDQNRSVTQQYVVKGSFTFIDKQDYGNFISYQDKLSPNFNIVLTGMYCFRIPDNQLLIDAFDRVKDQDLKYLAMEFVLLNLPLFLPSIQRFKNLTTLFLTYAEELVGTTLNDLAQILYELPELRNLGIRSSKIRNNLRGLLMKNCKIEDAHRAKKMKIEGDPGCCVVHRGKLRYLDISCCSVVDADLQCLEEYPFCANLKHLSIGGNTKLTTQRLADCLEHMASTLVILDTLCSFERPTNLQPIIDILYKFKMLKFLVLGHISFPNEQFYSLAKALFEIPCLIEIQMKCYCPRRELFPSEEEIVNLTNTLSKKGVHLHYK